MEPLFCLSAQNVSLSRTGRAGGAGSRSGEQTFGLFQSHSKWGEFFLVILEGLLVGRRIVLILCIIVKRHQGSCQNTQTPLFNHTAQTTCPSVSFAVARASFVFSVCVSAALRVAVAAVSSQSTCSGERAGAV